MMFTIPEVFVDYPNPISVTNAVQRCRSIYVTHRDTTETYTNNPATNDTEECHTDAPVTSDNTTDFTFRQCLLPCPLSTNPI